MNLIIKKLCIYAAADNVVTYQQMVDLMDELDFFYYTVEDFAENSLKIINRFKCDENQLIELNNELKNKTSNSLLLLTIDDIYKFDFLTQVKQQLTHGTKDAYHLKQKIEAVQTEDFYSIKDGDSVKQDENGNKLLAKSKYVHLINELQDDVRRVYNKKVEYLNVLKYLQEKQLIDFYDEINKIDVQPISFKEYSFSNLSISDKTKGSIAEEIKQTFNKSLVLISHKCNEILPEIKDKNNFEIVKDLSELYKKENYNELIKRITNEIKKNSNTKTVYQLLVKELQKQLKPIYNNYLSILGTLNTEPAIIKLKQQVKTEISYNMSL